MNYNIYSPSAYDTSYSAPVPVQPVTNAPTGEPQHVIYPYTGEPQPVVVQSIQPIPVGMPSPSNGPQPAFVAKTNPNSGMQTVPEPNFNMNGNPLSLILNESQFYVKTSNNSDCTGGFEFKVYPCDYFGECNDEVEPILFSKEKGFYLTLGGTVNGIHYTFVKKYNYSFVLNNESMNHRICKVKLESKCTNVALCVSFDDLAAPLEGRMVMNGSSGCISLKEGNSYGSIMADPEDSCGAPSRFLIIPSSKPNPKIDNQTMRVLYICLCALFAFV